jgi:hypothetical protein
MDILGVSTFWLLIMLYEFFHILNAYYQERNRGGWELMVIKSRCVVEGDHK